MAHRDARDGQREEMPQRLAPRGQDAAEWHQDRPENKQARGRACRPIRERHRTRRQPEEDVHEGETEERDVTEPSQAAAPAIVSANPVVAMEEQAADRPGEDAREY